MKKIFAIAAIAALTLTSCVKNEEAFAPVNNEIAFKDFALTSKAIISGTTMPTDEKIGCWALFNADNSSFVDNAEVSYKTSFWGFTTAYYWPNDLTKTLDFYAYYPKLETGTADGQASLNASQKIVLTGVSVGETVGSQTDYMMPDVATTGQNKTNTVALPFKHITSQIVFTVKDNTTTTGMTDKITVTKIEVLGADTKGTYTQGTGWSSIDAPKDFTIFSGTTALTSSATAIGNAILAIPQELTADVEKIRVTYTIAAITTPMSIAEQANQVKELDIRTASHTTWVKGKKYTYNIGFKLDDSSNEIKFNPTIEDWTPEDAGDYNI